MEDSDEMGTAKGVERWDSEEMRAREGDEEMGDSAETKPGSASTCRVQG